MKFKLTLAFDGTNYHGWQSQRSGRGVQDQLHAALARIFPSAPQVIGSSRTDAGVHALGMVVHFEIPPEEFRMPLRHLTLAVNACLPEDIRVLKAVRASADFHARFDASGKQYSYQIWNYPAMNPLLRNQAWHVATPLQLSPMREAASCLVGRHDFRAFTANRGGELKNPVRTLTRCDIRRSGGKLTLILEGEGFLYKMCRGIVGTLVQVGAGKYSPGDVGAILDSRDRRKAGVNAPACGLVLQEVYYKGKETAP